MSMTPSCGNLLSLQFYTLFSKLIIMCKIFYCRHMKSVSSLSVHTTCPQSSVQTTRRQLVSLHSFHFLNLSFHVQYHLHYIIHSIVVLISCVILYPHCNFPIQVWFWILNLSNLIWSYFKHVTSIIAFFIVILKISKRGQYTSIQYFPCVS